MANDEQYNLVKGIGSDSELEEYRQCFGKNGTIRQLDSLVWMHQQNLVNTNSIYYAFAQPSGSIAAIYTVLPVPVSIEGITTKAMQSVDTLTDVDHRGKGLFIKLATALYKNAEENAFALVYGFPNASSGPGFFKKLGWISFGEVPFLMKPLRLSFFVKKLFGKRSSEIKEEIIIKSQGPLNKEQGNGMSIKSIDQFGEDYNLLWNKVKINFKVAVNRDAHYLNWRFNKPGEFYYRYGLYVYDKLMAIVVFTIKEKHDGKVGYIMEFIFEPGNEKPAKILLRFATKFIKSQKGDVILAWCLPHSFNLSGYRGVGFLKLPEKFRPVQLFFGVKALQMGTVGVVTEVNNWYISYIDSDSV